VQGKGEFERSKVSSNHSALSFAGVKSKRDLKRGSASLQVFFPLSSQGRGIKGVGCQIKIKGVKSINLLRRGEGKRFFLENDVPLDLLPDESQKGPGGYPEKSRDFSGC